MMMMNALSGALNPAEYNSGRVTRRLREQVKEIDWSETAFPTRVKDIHKWESVNNINVNVFGYDEDTMKLYTIRLGELSEEITTINLFLHDDSHYCLITDLSRLISLQINE